MEMGVTGMHSFTKAGKTVKNNQKISHTFVLRKKNI